jgi:hypothetical protein
MSNRLNFSNINDAWALTDDNPKTPKFSYQKPKENIMTIDSNEIKVPMKKEFKPIQETYSDYVKPCSLVEEHIQNCDVCKSKLLKTTSNSSNKRSVINKLNNLEHMSSDIYLGSSFDLNEHFENISPSQKNLLIIVLYGILIILISDLIIKEKNE